MADDESNSRDEDLLAVDALIAENIALGFMEVTGVDQDGGVTYRLTAAGERRVRDLLNEEADRG